MKIIRPIAASDYQTLHEIAKESGIGFTSLPVNEELLRRKITNAEAAVQSTPTEPGMQSYLFVIDRKSVV